MTHKNRALPFLLFLHLFSCYGNESFFYENKSSFVRFTRNSSSTIHLIYPEHRIIVPAVRCSVR